MGGGGSCLPHSPYHRGVCAYTIMCVIYHAFYIRAIMVHHYNKLFHNIIILYDTSCRLACCPPPPDVERRRRGGVGTLACVSIRCHVACVLVYVALQLIVYCLVLMPYDPGIVSMYIYNKTTLIWIL